MVKKYGIIKRMRLCSKSLVVTWFTGLTCDELSAKVPRTNQRSKCKIGNKKEKKKKKQAHFKTRRLRPE